jgi:hypothetical protein
MARLSSEIEVPCPCCNATLVVDVHLKRVISHRVAARSDTPELHDAARILEEQAARREALFNQSVQAEQSRDDVLARRFEEALRQARSEPTDKPLRDFDLD